MKKRNQMIKKLSVIIFSMIAMATFGLSTAVAYEKEGPDTTISLPGSTPAVILIEVYENTGNSPVETSSNDASVKDNAYEKDAS